MPTSRGSDARATPAPTIIDSAAIHTNRCFMFASMLNNAAVSPPWAASAGARSGRERS